MARHDRAQVEKALSNDDYLSSIRSRLGEPQAALAELRRLAEDRASRKTPRGERRSRTGLPILAIRSSRYGESRATVRSRTDTDSNSVHIWAPAPGSASASDGRFKSRTSGERHGQISHSSSL
jgi:hypothetical protein